MKEQSEGITRRDAIRLIMWGAGVMLAEATLPLADAATTCYHIVRYGQSLSYGTEGCPPLSGSQYQSNQYFNGVILKPLVVNAPAAGCANAPIASITNFPTSPQSGALFNVTDAPDSTHCTGTPGSTKNVCTYNGSAWVVFSGGGGINLQEDSCEGLANQITLMSGGASGYVVVCDNYGKSGQTIAQLSKGNGTGYYAAMLTNIPLTKTAVQNAGYTYKFVCMSWTQGESDYITNLGNTSGASYEAALVQLQSDFQADVIAAIGAGSCFASTIPIFTDQMASWAAASPPTGDPCFSGGTGDSGSSCPNYTNAALGVPTAHWTTYRDNYQKVIFVCPKYQFGYESSLHMNDYSYRVLGELHGVAIYEWMTSSWQPLVPRAINHSGATVTVQCWLPSGASNLVIDTTLVPDKTGFTNTLRRGFAVYDTIAGSYLTQSAAPSVSGDTVTLTLSASTANALRVQYAHRSLLQSSLSGVVGTTNSVTPVAHANAPGGNIRADGPQTSWATSTGQLGPNGQTLNDTLYCWLACFDEPEGFSFNPNPISSSTKLSGGIKLSGGVKVQ